MNNSKMAKQFIGTIMAVLSLTIAVPFSSFAGWEQQGNDLKYLNSEGRYQTGDFIDQDGNIYKFDKEGIMQRNFNDTYSRSYGSDGKIINYMADSDGTRRSLSDRYLAGEQITFTSYEDMCKWWSYFNRYYNDFNLILDVPYKMSNTTYEITPWKEVLNSESIRSDLVQNTINELASKVTGGTIEEKVISAGKVVSNYLEPDTDIANKVFDTNISVDEIKYGMESIIQSKKGVCLAYAMLESRVLRAVGIDAEIVSGMVVTGTDGNRDYGYSHAWIRVNTNQGTGNAENWIYSDPMNYDVEKDEKLLNLPHRKYLTRYYTLGQYDVNKYGSKVY